MTLRLNFENSSHAEHFFHRYITYCRVQREDYDNHDCHPVIESHSDGYPVINWWNLDLISAAESDVIFIDSVFEGFNLFEQALTKHTLNQYPIDKHYVFLNSSEFTQKDYPMPYSYDIIQIQYILTRFHLVGNETTPRHYGYHDTSDWNTYHKPFLFNTIIGQKRPERDLFIKKIMSEFTYGSFIVKYDGELLTDEFSNSYLRDPFELEKVRKEKNVKILERLPSYARLSYGITKQCHFILAIDTCPLAKDNKGFITGHTLTNLHSQIPFITLGAPGLLRDLHKAGFRTWGELWDESYDQETDFQKRLDKCISVAKSLEAFDWKKHNKQITEIASHNLCNGMMLGKISIAEFNRLEKTVESLYNRNLVV